MKKLVFFVFICFIIFLSVPTLGQSTERNDEADYQVIPDEAIRLRILANSDVEIDQQIKRQVRDNVNAEITKWVHAIDDIDEARKLIKSKIPEINQIVEQTLHAHGETVNFEVEYGENIAFPAKLYGSYIYPAGNYEAVLITIGKGKGANWWCVLFPPLCFLDFSNGMSVASASTDDLGAGDTATADTMDEPVEVKFFLFEWIAMVIDFILSA